jgi:dihydroorotate dehydrogenase
MISSFLHQSLFHLEPETAHNLAIRSLKSGLYPRVRLPKADLRLETRVAGLRFPNPLGMAAGFDKNGEVVDALLDLGFGFTEVGTVTPLPQKGNPAPRIFRLKEDCAIINRLGFNNEGHEAVGKRLDRLRGRKGPVGVNLGANKTSDDFVSDYCKGLKVFNSVADYFTLNISSPNTPGLRGLQNKYQLAEMLTRVGETRHGFSKPIQKPVFLKIAPDNDDRALDDIVKIVLNEGAGVIDGLIISNTTIARPSSLRSRDKNEQGGLSGRPLFDPSTKVLAKVYLRLEGALPLIGVGGIENVQTALAKIRAGATLCQVYTGFVYQGPGLAGTILSGLSAYLDQHHLKSLSDLRGQDARQFAGQA